MKRSFFKAELAVEYLHTPEKEKGDANPFAKEEKERQNPYIHSAKVEIPEEILPELYDFLYKKGVFVGHLEGLNNKK